MTEIPWELEALVLLWVLWLVVGFCKGLLVVFLYGAILLLLFWLVDDGTLVESQTLRLL